MIDPSALKFGLIAAVPPTAFAAWTARTILNGRGEIDILPDRQSFSGTSRGPLSQYDVLELRSIVAEAFRNRWIVPERSDDVTLVIEAHPECDLIIQANTNGSHGYLYLAMWEQPRILHALQGQRIPDFVPGVHDARIIGHWLVPGERSQYAGAIVIAERVGDVDESIRYSTHIAYFMDDQGENNRWASSNGHYDMPKKKAVADFIERMWAHVY